MVEPRQLKNWGKPLTHTEKGGSNARVLVGAIKWSGGGVLWEDVGVASESAASKEGHTLAMP